MRADLMRPLPSDAATAKRMRAVRRTGTAPELIVRAWLRAQGVGYRIAPRTLPGRPDLANRSRGWALFVHGCFWHGHVGCRLATTPKRHAAWWAAKITANRVRDAAKIAALEAMHLRVLVVWQCEVEALRRFGAVPPSLASLAPPRAPQRCPASSS